MHKHFILTHGRSGSNFLVNTINLHPNLVNYGEVLGEWTLPYRLCNYKRCSDSDWSVFIDNLYSSSIYYYAAQVISLFSHLKKRKPSNFKTKNNITSIGIKDFAFLLKNRCLEDYLASNQDIKVIYLARKNQFNRYLSLLNMQITGQVKSETGNATKVSKFSIDIEDLLSSLKTYEAEMFIAEDILKDVSPSRILRIYYEDYFNNEENIQSTNRKVFEFLGVNSIDIYSSHKKILNNSLEELILNFQEVKEALAASPYNRYLEDI